MMEKTKLESLLSTCGELEGLLMIAIKHDSETPCAIYNSIKEKINLLADEISFVNTTYCQAETINANKQEEDSEIEADEIADATEFEEESDSDSTPAKEEDTVAKTHVTHTKFSINDRYQFIRELFNGNEAEFKDAVEALEEMETQEDMADYLYNDLCLDEHNPSVAHFISIMMKSKNHV